MSVNKAILVGNLGAKPELRHTPTGQTTCELRVATSERFKDKAGQQQERTEWHTVVAWGKTAEHCAQYLDKGRQVYVEGRLHTRSWEAKDGSGKRYVTEVVADTVKFLGGAPRGSQEATAHASEAPAIEPGEDTIPF